MRKWMEVKIRLRLQFKTKKTNCFQFKISQALLESKLVKIRSPVLSKSRQQEACLGPNKAQQLVIAHQLNKKPVVQRLMENNKSQNKTLHKEVFLQLQAKMQIHPLVFSQNRQGRDFPTQNLQTYLDNLKLKISKLIQNKR